MNRFIFTSLLAIAIMLSACKTDTKKSNLPDNPIKDAVATSPHNNDYRANALSILDFRNNKTEGKSFSIIEADTWEYQFVYTGRYHYDSDSAVLIMVDNDGSKKPQEWSAKFAGDAMVLVGTNSYNDNSIQMKLERVADATFQ